MKTTGTSTRAKLAQTQKVAGKQSPDASRKQLQRVLEARDDAKQSK